MLLSPSKDENDAPIIPGIPENRVTCFEEIQQEVELSMEKCPDCDASVDVPNDAVQGEIVSCPDCGLDLEVSLNGESRSIKALVIEKEDWGE